MTEKNNKKTKDSKKKPKIEAPKIYNRRDLADRILSNRDVDFYIRNSTRNINISLAIMLVALLFTVLKVYEISTYPSRSNYYIAGVDGRVYSLNWTEEKKKKTFDSIVEIREKNRLEREARSSNE